MKEVNGDTGLDESDPVNINLVMLAASLIDGCATPRLSVWASIKVIRGKEAGNRFDRVKISSIYKAVDAFTRR
jgi:hypothetical protein